MEISSAASASSGATNAVPAKQGASITQDFETFLRMLTAQARYQDPLDPISASDYSAQLAQFSMVEQQVLSNDLLSSLSAALGGADIASLAGWVGMEGRVSGPVGFEGRPVTLVPTPEATAGQAFLLVRDSDGELVQTIQLPANSSQMEWDGKSPTGQLLPSAVYDLSVQSLSNGEVISEVPVDHYSKIVEAQIREGKLHLLMNGGHAVAADSVIALRAARS